jgi:uncharacterized protein YndB with AHSA1/START domain
MTRTADHSTFVIERVLSAGVDRVFAAWASVEQKQRWFGCHDDWRRLEHHLDFREGGAEVSAVATADGVVHRMEARYLDIVPGARIVYAYAMYVGAARISVSLATVELAARAGKTVMTFTEQVVFLDGHGDVDGRRQGTEVGLDALVALFAGPIGAR